MGHVYQEVKVTAKKSKTVRMFVDTGATFSVLPPALATEIGVVCLAKPYRVRLAAGHSVKMSPGLAIFRINGRETPSTVLIGKVDEPILGVETLEALGLAVDPSAGGLKETRSYTVRLGGVR